MLTSLISTAGEGQTIDIGVNDNPRCTPEGMNGRAYGDNCEVAFSQESLRWISDGLGLRVSGRTTSDMYGHAHVPMNRPWAFTFVAFLVFARPFVFSLGDGIIGKRFRYFHIHAVSVYHGRSSLVKRSRLLIAVHDLYDLDTEFAEPGSTRGP